MMKAELVDIALRKNDRPGAQAALQHIRSAVQALEQAESLLIGRIRDSQAARGAPPPRLSKSQQALVADFAQDARDGHLDVLAQLQALGSAQEVVWSLAFALENDLQRSPSFLKHCPAPERALFEEIDGLKRQALEAMQAYLEAFPPPP